MGKEMLDFNFEGFGTGNQETMEALTKALTAGSGVDAANFTGGRALIPESLDTTLVNVLWDQDEARLFKELKKQPVKGPVHQWNKRTSVGEDDGAWVAEGGDSSEADQDIKRQFVTMKYLQTLRKATLQAVISNSVEEAIAIEKNAGTLWIIRQVERILFEGDSSVVEEEPDGLDKLIPTANVLDMRGKLASTSEFEAAMEEGARIIRENFGVPTHLFNSLKTQADVQNLIKDRIRFPVGDGNAQGNTIGNQVFNEYPTTFGKFKLVDDVFIKEGLKPRASVIVDKRPSQPTIAVSRQAASGGRTSKFVAADAGLYYYQVSAINKYGASQPSAPVVVSAAVQAGDEVVIAITDGAIAGTGYLVYRSKKAAADGSDCRLMFKIARSGANPTIYDLNADLPGCANSYLLNLSPLYNAIEWNQFLPLMKFDLYPTNAAVYPFLMLLFGALGVKKGEQLVRIKNIAPRDLGWF